MTRYPSPSKIFFDGLAAFIAPTANQKQDMVEMTAKYCEMMTNAQGLNYRSMYVSLNSSLGALNLRDDIDAYDSLVSFLSVELQLHYATVQGRRDNALDSRMVMAFDPKQGKPLPCLVLFFSRHEWGTVSGNHDVGVYVFGTKSYVDTFESSMEKHCMSWFLHHRVGPPTLDENWVIQQSYH